MIIGYSAILGVAVEPLFASTLLLISAELIWPFASDRRSELVELLFSLAHGNKIKAPTTNKNTSIAWVTLVTWNKPLYNPSPADELIAWIYRLLNDNAALNNKIIDVIRVNKIGVIVDE
jgi:hypothetical protein